MILLIPFALPLQPLSALRQPLQPTPEYELAFGLLVQVRFHVRPRRLRRVELFRGDPNLLRKLASPHLHHPPS